MESFAIITASRELFTLEEIETFRAAYSQQNEHLYRFRIYDSDMNFYFEGLSRKNWSFGPLWHFGEAFGCTTIFYQDKGHFTEL